MILSNIALAKKRDREKKILHFDRGFLSVVFFKICTIPSTP